MPVTNIECQIAKGQIGRYLAGDPLSPEALKQLEAHIADCPDCKEALQDRESALKSMLGKKPATPSVDFETPADSAVEADTKPNPMAAAIRSQLEAERLQKAELVAEQLRLAKEVQEIQEKPKGKGLKMPAGNYKPLILSCALALVLIGMSYMSKSGIGPFGAKADSILPADSGNTVAKTDKPAAKPAVDIKKAEPAASVPAGPNPGITATASSLTATVPNTTVSPTPTREPGKVETAPSTHPGSATSPLPPVQKVTPVPTQPAAVTKPVAKAAPKVAAPKAASVNHVVAKPAAPKPATPKPAPIKKVAKIAAKPKAAAPVHHAAKPVVHRAKAAPHRWSKAKHLKKRHWLPKAGSGVVHLYK